MKKVITAGSPLAGTALEVPEPPKNRGRLCAGKLARTVLRGRKLPGGFMLRAMCINDSFGIK